MAGWKTTLRQTGRFMLDAVESRTAWPSRPAQLTFEITAACDARCIHCPRQEMDRPKRPMDFELFTRMIDQAAEMRIPELVPNGYGEILTLPRLGEYLAYIRSKAHRFKLLLNTNGYNFTEEKLRLLFDHELDGINITIDGATAETAQAIRVGLKTERIERNIHRLLEMRRERGVRRPFVRVGMVALPQNVHEGPMFLRKWEGVADAVVVAHMSDRLGSLDLADPHAGKVDTPSACVRPFRELNIWSSGMAVLCCEDWNQQHVVGDLQHETLQEIWRGGALTAARSAHSRGCGADIAICAACNHWMQPPRFVKLWN
ncbi:MAG TPA: radical SAM/SPASM domain-containing protein [Vicinamibacterales bacterium]